MKYIVHIAAATLLGVSLSAMSAPSVQCGNTQINLNDSMDKVKKACGKPSFMRAKMGKGAILVYKTPAGPMGFKFRKNQLKCIRFCRDE